MLSLKSMNSEYIRANAVSKKTTKKLYSKPTVRWKMTQGHLTNKNDISEKQIFSSFNKSKEKIWCLISLSHFPLVDITPKMKKSRPKC